MSGLEAGDRAFSLALVDGDIIAYRCSAATDGVQCVSCGAKYKAEVAEAEGYECKKCGASKTKPITEGDCLKALNDMMEYCLYQTVGFKTESNFKVFLTGGNNFRYELAKTYHYKGNRKDVEKPTHLPYARKYLVKNWGAVIVEGAEADDAIAEEAAKNPTSVIVSQDKDFNTVEGWKFNFVNGLWRYDDERSALEYFYSQVLTGDTADNIVGLYRVGPKKAENLLAGWVDEKDLFERCLKAYKDSPTLEGDPYERVVENARLLHLRRYQGQVWEPPK